MSEIISSQTVALEICGADLSPRSRDGFRLRPFAQRAAAASWGLVGLIEMIPASLVGGALYREY